MKKTRLILFLLVCVLSSTQAQEIVKEISSIKQEVVSLKAENNHLKKEVEKLTRQNKKAGNRISELEKSTKFMSLQIDRLQNQLVALSNTQKADNETLTVKLGETKQDVQANQQQLSSRTTWGIISVILLLAVICTIVLLFLRKFKTGTTSITEVRKAQDALRDAQTKMQEESIKLDNQLLAVASQQMVATQLPKGNDAEPDHSLAKKVADEIVRIELNLSRMDSSIKGHKQLAKAVQRIKDNFNANGYEIVDMLGKPYNEGMRINADFAIDESLEPGTRIITSITKPQIMFNGQLIQKATVTVTQNI